ncbi:MAG: lantibiotic dehydratase [Paraglaciecola sp.]|uniref:lantibiotic dehydratase n=1 Tax=Paraglaciecola sp. TaxID=1920173 RepID=UPI003297F70A
MLKTRIKNEDFFVIRTPRMPVNNLLSLDSNKEKTRQLISQWVELPEVIEALYLATPSLLERIHYWQKKPDSKEGRKFEQTLLKYMIRMGSRSTPFGLFSGIHCGKITSQTNLEIHYLDKDSRKTRLDMFYLFAIKEHLLRTDIRNSNLKYYPNPSHYYVARQYRYIEAYQSNKTLQYRLSAIEVDEYFSFLLDNTKNGLTFNTLLDNFLNHYKDAIQEEVETYIQQFIEESVLIADIPLSVTGKSPDSTFLTSLNRIGEVSTANHLNTVLDHLNKMDQRKSAEVKDYKYVFEHLNKLPIQAEESKLFQADIYRSFEHCELHQVEVSKLLKQLLLLKGLSHQDFEPFSDFMSKFNVRFEGQFVPLNKLLDDETGISFSHETGYEAPLLAGLNLTRQRIQRNNTPRVSMLDTIVTQAITAPENRNKQIIHLTSKELNKHLGARSLDVDLPASFASIISLYQDKNQNRIIKFNGCYGPSVANLLGRFCHLHSELEDNIKEHLLKEEQHSPDVIFAEIVHIPEGRPGNVIARPYLRKYEIIFMADSDLNHEYQIPISDLYVWIEQQQIKLWSKRLQKQIVPRLSSAHNYTSRSLSVYKFLSMLQRQSGTPPEFSLPASQALTSFIPRIMLDNLILSEKMWRIPREELEELIKQSEIDYVKLRVLQEKYELDNIVSLAANDNVLQLNLRNPQMLDILLSETKGQRLVELKEVLVAQYQTPVKSLKDEWYTNELIIPFFNTDAKSHQTFKDNPQRDIEAIQIKRRFSPGSEWLSLKIYSGNGSVETALAEKIFPLIESSIAYFNKWFFIRYGDPDWHLRLRFNGEFSQLYGSLLPKLSQLFDPMLENGEIHKIDIFTYEREIERYGGAASIDLVESLFMADSQLVARTSQLIQEYGEDIRWRITLLVTDKLLDLFEYTAAEKLELISQLRADFGIEFNESGTLRKQLGIRYRNVESIIKDDFNKIDSTTENEISESQQAIFSLIKKWQEEARTYAQAIHKMYLGDIGLNCSRDSLLGSLLHMHNNRMFKAYGREQELVMHDFLRRVYFSKGKIIN